MFVYLCLTFIVLYYISDVYYITYLLDKVASTLSYILLTLSTKYYNIAKKNISLVFPDFGEQKVEQILYQSLKVSIINGLSGLFGRCLYRTNYYKNININIPDKLLRDINNNGIILVTPHIGIMYNISNYLGYFTKKNTRVVYKKQKYINHLLYPSNTYSNTRFIPFDSDTLYKLMKIKGGITSLACDQKAYNNKPKIKFLNHLVKFHYGPALLHLKTGRKIWYIDITYDLKTMKQQAYFVDISSQLIKNSTDTDITQKIADTMSERIMLHPEQYLWFYNRFSKNQYN